jgi:hypothetical protein
MPSAVGSIRTAILASQSLTSPHLSPQLGAVEIRWDIGRETKLWPVWCGRPGSNRHGGCPPTDFKSVASTNSATPAAALSPYRVGEIWSSGLAASRPFSLHEASPSCAHSGSWARCRKLTCGARGLAATNDPSLPFGTAGCGQRRWDSLAQFSGIREVPRVRSANRSRAPRTQPPAPDSCEGRPGRRRRPCDGRP